MAIKKIKKLNKKDTGIAGGKGASLGEMVNLGIPVPKGFVILAETFDEFLKDTDLFQEIESGLDQVNYDDINSVEKCSKTIQALIKEFEIPFHLAEEFLSEFDKLGARFVAVRSSATAEDSSEASWAGELESYLNTTREALLENIRNCWASLYTPRAIFYRKEKDLSREYISVAVVVQEMVEAEISGITFTAHPVTEDPNQMIIEAAWGLGEAVVSGAVTPDSYVVDKKTWEILDINVNSQDRKLVRDENGGNRRVRVDGEHRYKQILSEDQIIELGKLCQKIEDHYAYPQDIEWAFRKGEFYIVQARPITTL